MNDRPPVREKQLSQAVDERSVLFRVAELKYFAGANQHAGHSVLWMRFGTSEAGATGAFEQRFLRQLEAVGLPAAEIAVRAERLAGVLPKPLALCATAIAEVLALGVIKGMHLRPEIIVCGEDGNAIAIVSPSEAEAREAMSLVLAVFTDALETSTSALRSFARNLASKADLPSLGVILNAAEKRGIPWLWNEAAGYHQLGHGHHRVRIDRTTTGNLPVLGFDVAVRKSVTNRLLRSLALPAPLSVTVTDIDDAVAAAERIGYPVVVKPSVGSKGNGITVGVNGADQLAAAFRKARRIDRTVIVEEFVPGEDVRLLVVGKKLIAAVCRQAARVEGDGTSSIAELIEAENARRKHRRGFALQIDADSDLTQTLARQGLTLSSVLPAHSAAKLRTVANWSQGGTATDVTGMVHPDNADMAVRAALAAGVDVAGVDFITPDVSRPYYEAGGAICEVNYRPGLRVHMAADPERNRDLGSPIIDSLISGNGRIDVIYVIDAGDNTFAGALAGHYRQAGKSVRVACGYETPETWQRQIEMAFDDPDCAALIISVPSAAVVDLGTGIDYCRMVVRMGLANAAQEKALRILGQICTSEIVLTAEAAANVEAAAGRIAKALELAAKPAEMAPSPARMATARSLRTVAEERGHAVSERVWWGDMALLQIGYGARQALYRGARTGSTSYIATRIADDKQRTNAVLKAHDLPHPSQAVVESATAALLAARGFGYPVIVKPLNSSESYGVTGNILDDRDLAAAIAGAFEHSTKIIVEPFLPGQDHRFLVIDGKVAHVTCHVPAHVVGDGKQTVEELVAEANKSPIRGPNVYQPYEWLELEGDGDRMLARQGLNRTSVPARGQLVRLSSISSLSSGATAINVTDVAHPDNIWAAERAARLVGLDICGVDFLLSDASKSYRETGGAILEVNQRPSFDMHDACTDNTNRIRSLVLRMLSKAREDFQIPVVHCILNDACPAEAVVQAVLQEMGSTFGLTVGAAAPALGLAMIGAATIKSGGAEPAPICRSILADPRVEGALFLTYGEQQAEIPSSAKIIDFRQSGHNCPVRDVSAAIVKQFTGALAETEQIRA